MTRDEVQLKAEGDEDDQAVYSMQYAVTGVSEVSRSACDNV